MAIPCILKLLMGCWKASENLPHTGDQTSHDALENRRSRVVELSHRPSYMDSIMRYLFLCSRDSLQTCLGFRAMYKRPTDACYFMLHMRRIWNVDDHPLPFENLNG